MEVSTINQPPLQAPWENRLTPGRFSFFKENMSIIAHAVSTEIFSRIAGQYPTPLYVYDEGSIVERCREVLSMPNAFGLRVAFAMKANSSRAILQLIHAQGVGIDASSLNEARRAHLAGIPLSHITLTSQEVQTGADRSDLESMMLGGLRYNVCSLRQLALVADFAAANRLALSMRVHPGEGSGESVTRNTGDKYSCFGVHLSDMEEAQRVAREKGVVFDSVHVHIGSGGDPEAWRNNIDRELEFADKWFPDATSVNFGGGFKVARMPGEVEADISDLGNYAKTRFEEFARRTGRKLKMEVEPGTYYVANSGYLVTRVIDKKQTGDDGFQFLVLDGGMEVNCRPLLYGSRHPFYAVSSDGKLLSSEFDLSGLSPDKDARMIVGRCCESGDSQSLDEQGRIIARPIADLAIGDLVIIGGAGAYCSSMTPFNYNSHMQAAEVLVRSDGRIALIRRTQTMEQLLANEIDLA